MPDFDFDAFNHENDMYEGEEGNEGHAPEIQATPEFTQQLPPQDSNDNSSSFSNPSASEDVDKW
jgi:hypothetical protein